MIVAVAFAGRHLLLTLGDADDAPRLSLLGFVAVFLLIMWGIYNTGVIGTGLFVPVIWYDSYLFVPIAPPKAAFTIEFESGKMPLDGSADKMAAHP